MFLKPCVFFKAVAACQAFRRPAALPALGSLSTPGFGPSRSQSSGHGRSLAPSLQFHSSHSQFCGHRSMLAASPITCSGQPPAQHLDPWRKRLLTTRSFVQHLSSYGGAFAVSIGVSHLRRQQAVLGKRRNALNQGVTLVETNAPASMQRAEQASTSSSSDSDAEQPSIDDAGRPSGAAQK